MTITRRTVLTGLAAAAAVPAMPRAVAAQAMASLPAIRERTLAFLSALAPDKAARARFEMGSPTWREWNFMGINLIKPGIRFEEMDAREQEAGVALLEALLSPEGFAKAERVRLLQDVLAALGVGPPDRNSNRYSFAIFGEPAAGELWGARFEGHHLTLTATLLGDEMVAVTPSSFSCNPNDVTIGPTAGTTAIIAEEQLARTLFADLSPAAQARARIADRAYSNILSLAGLEDRFARREGLPAADLTAAQQDLLWQLVETYAAEHWPGPVADAQRERIRAGDREAVHFAWGGANEPDTRLYYRLHGDTFVIELASVDSVAQHLHTIYHDPERTLGRHIAG